MSKKFGLSALLGCAILASSGASCAAALSVDKPGHHHSSVRVGGKKRTFDVFIPQGDRGRVGLPLVIVLHGGLGSGLSARWDSRMSAEARKRNFIVAYPNGLYRTWNADGCCGPARLFKVDDVAFIRELISTLTAQLQIDPERVFVTGISNGGMLAYKLASELPDQIAAIAPVEGCMYPTTRATSPVSVISIHGTKDRIIRYDGGTGSMFGYKVTSTSAPDTIEFWAKQNGCASDPIKTDTPTFTKVLYPNGKLGTEACLYTIKNSGHVWPGGRRCIFLGDRPRQDFSATEAMCDFFLTHPKRRPVASSAQ